VKAQAGGSGFEQGNRASALRAVRVGFAIAPLAADQNLRCRLTSIHYGIHGFIHGQSTTRLNYKTNCFCAGDQFSCDQL
jgi:hypothetical protein